MENPSDKRGSRTVCSPPTSKRAVGEGRNLRQRHSLHNLAPSLPLRSPPPNGQLESLHILRSLADGSSRGRGPRDAHPPSPPSFPQIKQASIPPSAPEDNKTRHTSRLSDMQVIRQACNSSLGTIQYDSTRGVYGESSGGCGQRRHHHPYLAQRAIA